MGRGPPTEAVWPAPRPETSVSAREEHPPGASDPPRPLARAILPRIATGTTLDARSLARRGEGQMEEQLPSRRGRPTTWLSRSEANLRQPGCRPEEGATPHHPLVVFHGLCEVATFSERAGRCEHALRCAGPGAHRHRGGLASASPRDRGDHRGHEPGPAPLDRPAEGLVVLAGAPRLARRARSPRAAGDSPNSRRALSRRQVRGSRVWDEGIAPDCVSREPRGVAGDAGTSRPRLRTRGPSRTSHGGSRD